MVKKAVVLVPCLLALLAVWPGCSSGPTDPGKTVDLSGRITLGASPFEAVDVYLSWGASRKMTTGTDGRFSFTGLTGGSYLITPVKPGYAFSPSNFNVGTSTRSDLNAAAAAATYGTAVETIARDFTANDQNGLPVTLSSFHGKVVLLDFTADWCGVCREKAQTAEAFYQQYRARGFVYILVVIQGSPSVWAQTYGLTFPVLDDSGRAIYVHYQMTPDNLPLPHVLDRNMTIRYKMEGWAKAEVEDWIKKLL